MVSIRTNLMALTGQQHQAQAQDNLSTAMERLSSGLRVNGAKDDAAGLAIGNRMTSQITGRTQAMRNANDGVSLTQTAEGALNEVNDIDRLPGKAVNVILGDPSTTVRYADEHSGTTMPADTKLTSLSAACSHIMDADYAEEAARMTKSQILQQTGNSMLTQANHAPQSVLSLLG
jgi:flagellin